MKEQEIEVGYRALRDWIRDNLGQATLESYEESLKQAGRRQVREWLDNHKAYSTVVSGSGVWLPILDPAEYERLYLALKAGEMPKEAK